MKKKKLLFMLIDMNIGGTEKAFLSMLEEINSEKYDVKLLMLEENGDFLENVPSWVEIKYIDNYEKMKLIMEDPLHISALKFLIKGKIFKFINMIKQYKEYKKNNEMSSLFKYLLEDSVILDEEYDIAVAYAGPMDFISYFIINKINAKKKVQWIHFDVTKCGFNSKFATKWYNKFDKIFVVSKEGKEKLDELVPCIKNKTEVFSNIISKDIIKNMANDGDGFEDDFEGIRILTVGRLAWEKGQDITIPVLARLKSEGYNIRWYCIGDGDLRTKCQKLIKKYKLEEDYILLGTKSNPYPYMKECDIYVQPSVHEGYCITLAEARCFNNPIVATDFTGANEQLIETGCGLVAEISEDSIYKNIKLILDNADLSNEIKLKLKKSMINSTDEINKLYRIIEVEEIDRVGENEKNLIYDN